MPFSLFFLPSVLSVGMVIGSLVIIAFRAKVSIYLYGLWELAMPDLFTWIDQRISAAVQAAETILPRLQQVFRGRAGYS